MNIEELIGQDAGYRLGDIEEHFTGVAEDVKEYGVYDNKKGAMDIYDSDVKLMRDAYIRDFKDIDLGEYDFEGKLEVGRVKGYAKLEKLFE